MSLWVDLCYIILNSSSGLVPRAEKDYSNNRIFYILIHVLFFCFTNATLRYHLLLLVHLLKITRTTHLLIYCTRTHSKRQIYKPAYTRITTHAYIHKRIHIFAHLLLCITYIRMYMHNISYYLVSVAFCSDIY